MYCSYGRFALILMRLSLVVKRCCVWGINALIVSLLQCVRKDPQYSRLRPLSSPQRLSGETSAELCRGRRETPPDPGASNQASEMHKKVELRQNLVMQGDNQILGHCQRTAKVSLHLKSFSQYSINFQYFGIYNYV